MDVVIASHSGYDDVFEVESRPRPLLHFTATVFGDYVGGCSGED